MAQANDTTNNKPVSANDDVGKAADTQAQQDANAQEAAAAADDSTQLPHEKDTSRTAALRK